MIKNIILTISLLVLFAGEVSADCRGCCSRHDGVVCVEGKTRCGDGSQLSAKCKAKGCSKCDGEETPVQASVKVVQSSVEYDRKDWPHWVDEDKDCQDTRAEILIRDNTGEIKFKRNKSCNVSWGKWLCPYTGQTFTKASDVDIDHIVPLSWAHHHGAANWSREQKRAFANDPMNLLVVDDSTNQEKSDKGPDEWMPPLKSFHKEYLERWHAVVEKYGLTVSASEEKALSK